MPYRTIGGIGCLLYFLAALMPAISFMAGGIVGLGGGYSSHLIAGA
ncbi:MAG: hypothetical protein M5U34_34835 [Chloroflexi bacterium]|nr:hypothetical protein [Chloroflexota bacterium]